MTNTHTIAEADEGIRLDRWFKRHHPGFPHAMLEKHLRKGQIRLDGKKVKSSDRLQAGQVLTLPQMDFKPPTTLPKKKYIPTTHEEKELQKLVLYKDDQLIAINKPAGLPVQGGTKVKKSLDDMLDALSFGAGRPKLTHRLDRDTSGVLLLARDAKSANFLTKQFAGKTIGKTYLALVHGTPLPMTGTIKDKLGKVTDEDSEKEYVTADEKGKSAVTHYRVLESLAGKFAVMELTPETGRTHQLRVHMQSLGCPIVGDPKYGGSSDVGRSIGMEDRLHLHAWKIKFKQVNGRMLEIKAPLPPHMQKTFSALGIEAPK